MEMGGKMRVLRKELKKTSVLAAPMVVTTLLQYLMQVVSLMMVGHLGQLPLSAVAIATALTNVTGFSLLVVLKKCKEMVRSFLVVREFFRFAVPAAVMVCLKWWSCELITLLSGLLPNPKLESSVLAICLTITTLHFTIPYGLGAVASTRVSNEIGGGNLEGAEVAVQAVVVLAVIDAVVVSTLVFSCRYLLGDAYSNDKQVVDYVAAMTPLICISIVMDSLQGVLSGIARGSGWQKMGAYVNLGAFYLVGIPVAVILGFLVHLKGKGLWIGIVAGSVVQATLLSLITAFTNWKKQEIKARERIIGGSASGEN